MCLFITDRVTYLNRYGFQLIFHSQNLNQNVAVK
jgi:hypothetical protein